MHILLTNDDGIRAPGIQALRSVLQDIAEITVAAPAQQQSATGHSITVYHPIWVDVQPFDEPNVKGWRIGGTPADSVKIALDALMQSRPDLVIAGINHGPNLGTDVLYSGTVSAALEGSMHGIPAIAVSLATFGEPDFVPAAQFCRNIVCLIRDRKLPPFRLLNINVPAVPLEDIRGVALTRLGSIEYENAFEKRSDPRGRTYYWMGGTPAETRNADDTDVAAVRGNRISVTPVHFDLTDYLQLDQFRRCNPPDSTVFGFPT